MSSSSPHIDDSSRPMPTRLLTSLKRPFSRPKNDHDRYPSSSERTRGPIHREAPPNYQQIAMGLHLSRTPHLPVHLAPQYPPTTAAARLQRSASVPTRPPTSHSRSHSNSQPPPPARPSRLLPPPTRSALKKPTTTTTTRSSSVTPDTASASTVASSGPPLTPTRFLSGGGGGGGGGLLARFLGKERGRAAATAAGLTLVVPERTSKAVRFEEEGES